MQNGYGAAQLIFSIAPCKFIALNLLCFIFDKLAFFLYCSSNYLESASCRSFFRVRQRERVCEKEREKDRYLYIYEERERERLRERKKDREREREREKDKERERNIKRERGRETNSTF